jgi:alkylated DNA repair dioxygenase AlkB
MLTLRQAALFPELPCAMPGGFCAREEFVTREEEARLAGYLEHLPLAHPTTDGYPAKRRVFGFGWSYDFEKDAFVPGPPLPPFLLPLARRAAKWADIPATRVVEALVTEYPPGSAIGWHRDNERFEHVIGVSLMGGAEFRLRPLSPARGKGLRTASELRALWLPARSAYVMQGESRWEFQHSVAPVPALRYSITLRTLPSGFFPNRALS